MTPTDELFQVIKSLKQTEKRYFKVFASMHDKGENSIYIKLFDVIEKQKEYNEKKLKEKFKGKIFIKQLAATKYHLLNLILKSLRNYYSNTSAENKANQLLLNIEILFGKGLYALCAKHIDKVKKLSDQYEIYEYYVKALDWEKKIMSKQGFLNYNYSHIEKIINEEKVAFSKLENIGQFQNLQSKSGYWHTKKGISRNTSEYHKHYNAIIRDPIFKEQKAITNRSKNTFYILKSFFSKNKGDNTQSLKYIKKLVDFFEQYPEQISQSPDIFLSAINNLANELNLIGKPKEAITTIEKIKYVTLLKSGINDNILKSRALGLNLMFKTHTYLKIAEFNKAIALIPEFEAEGSFIKRRVYLVIIYNISCAYFGIKDFKNALKWLGKILNYNEAEMVEDVNCFAKIINLIIHFELGNDEHLEYIVKSTYRYLYKKNRLFKIETVILDFIRKTSKLETKKDFIPAFKELKKKLLVLSKDPYEARAFEYFDFISWLDSKIENRSFVEIVKKKVKSSIKQ